MHTPRDSANASKSMRTWIGVIAVAALAAGCLVSSKDVRYDELISGRVTLFEVPDTTASDEPISVHIAGEAGPNSAYRFESIETYSRGQTWVIDPRIRHYEERDEAYLPAVSTFDLTIQLAPFEEGYTHFEVISRDTTIVDSTLVVPAAKSR